jgi:hypothetical protein
MLNCPYKKFTGRGILQVQSFKNYPPFIGNVESRIVSIGRIKGVTIARYLLLSRPGFKAMVPGDSTCQLFAILIGLQPGHFGLKYQLDRPPFIYRLPGE